MSQCFKLVNGGFVDKVIVFDVLPERFLKNVRTREAAGFPRAWAKWLASIGSMRTVYKTETSVDLARNWTFKKTPIGLEPCFFVLDYTDTNADKQSWREICEYVRMNVGPEVRLKEKLEDMAIQFAPNPTMALDIEPEQVPVIPIPDDVVEKPELHDLVKPEETILVTEPAKRKGGRPKKAVVEA